MRMFLVGMCDIFLILYLTAITNVQPATVWTVDDIYKLSQMQDSMQADKDKAAEELRKAQEERERLLAEKKRQEELAAQRLKELQENKNKLKEAEQSLALSDQVRERIAQDLIAKEQMLKDREQLLVSLNQEIRRKEEARRELEETFQKELEVTKEAIASTRMQAKQLEIEARQAQNLANEMQKEADQAYQTAITAKDVQRQALKLKDEALKQKEDAERKAAEALAAKQRAEVEKDEALEAAQTAKEQKQQAEKKAQVLAKTVEEIKQDGETAYTKNVRPQLQKIFVTYRRKVSTEIMKYERELTLLPVMINDKVYGVFPSRQIGFTQRSDRAPDGLAIRYKGQRVIEGWIDTERDLIAVELPGYDGKASQPYAHDTELTELMPALLALRNNGDVGLTDAIRGLSDDYFIVNRDYLEVAEDGVITYAMTGFRGTGARGERIVRGDQLVDLSGRLIGIAADANEVIRVDSLDGWKESGF